MKLNRPLLAFVLIVLIGCFALTPLLASASVTVANGSLEVLPGNPQSSSPAYSKAWLDTVVIRDGSTALTACKPTPKPSYPYSKTYEEFVDEVARYDLLHDLNETTVGNAYTEVIDAFYYMVTAMGMTDRQSTMKAYLTDYGIAVPTNPTSTEQAEIAGVYAALKYNAPYVLYEKDVTLPKGTTLEGAEVALMAELMDVFLPSDINTVNGLAVQAAKTHVEEFPELPISENPSNSEVFHWSKVLTAASNDYEVPLTPYEEASAAQREYVDYAYYASIFETIYDIHVSPAKLAVAAASPDKLAVQKVILSEMLDEKEVPYAPDATCAQLFEAACAAGCFELDQEFYSDVFDYDLLVPAACTQLWFTPFALASQLGGSNDDVTLYLDGKELKPSGTTYAALDLNRISQEVQLVSRYDDGFHPAEQVVYRFNVVHTEGVVGSDLVNEFQTLLDRAAATEGGNAEKLVNQVVDFANEQAVDSIFEQNVQSTLFSGETLTTYGDAQNGTSTADGNNADYNYLGQLIDETYPEDETAVSKSLLDDLSVTEESHASSLVVRTGQAIIEHPQIVAAPTGIVALGGLLGYFFSHKKKGGSPLDTPEQEYETGDDE